MRYAIAPGIAASAFFAGVTTYYFHTAFTLGRRTGLLLAAMAIVDADGRSVGSSGRFSAFDVRAGAIRALSRSGIVAARADLDQVIAEVASGAYRIDDMTGTLWVVSDKGVPRQGARVKVTGTVREGFNLGSLGGRINLPAGVGAGLIVIESSHKAN